MVGMHASQVVGLMSTGVHKAAESSPLSFGLIPLARRADWLPVLWGRPKREPTTPHHHYISGLKEEGGNITGGSLPSGPSEAIVGPQESLCS